LELKERNKKSMEM